MVYAKRVYLWRENSEEIASRRGSDAGNQIIKGPKPIATALVPSSRWRPNSVQDGLEQGNKRLTVVAWDVSYPCSSPSTRVPQEQCDCSSKMWTDFHHILLFQKHFGPGGWKVKNVTWSTTAPPRYSSPVVEISNLGFGITARCCCSVAIGSVSGSILQPAAGSANIHRN